MIPPLNDLLPMLKGLDPKKSDICTLELTVVTGLEETASSECVEKLGVSPIKSRGRIFFDIEIDKAPQALLLRSVDHINVILSVEPNFSFPEDRDQCLEKLYHFCKVPNWKKGMLVWQKIFGPLENLFDFEQEIMHTACVPRPEIDLKLLKTESEISSNLPKEIWTKNEENESAKDNEISENTEPVEADLKENIPHDDRRITTLEGPKFRVSCHRVGKNHNFGSPEAARQFGGGINEKFGWPVDLSKHDMEVLLYINGNHVYVAICLTKEALFRRNITFFGPTNLRASICYNMVRLANPKVGDIIMDPMCGGATIPIEGSLTHPKCMLLGGDYSKAAVYRSVQNIDALLEKQKKMNIDITRWNVTRLPIRNQSIDIAISDLPFGKRIGSKVDNRVLYYRMLVEVARVTRTDTGRAVFLTHDRNSMIMNLRRVSKLWKNYATKTTNIGGLVAGVFLLRRTNLLSDPKATLDAFKISRTNRKRSVSNSKSEGSESS